MKKPGLMPPLTSRRRLLFSGMTLALLGTGPARARPEPARLKPGSSPIKAPDAQGKRIVMIDPGHGGIDSGAVGEGGSEEKHVVLEIANHIREMLSTHPHIEARLTRESDKFIPLGERVEIAHQHGASLFMSIHADGFTSPDAHGASVFALSTRGASSRMARYLSKRENASDAIGGVKAAQQDRYLQQAIFDLVQTDTIRNSLTLGKHVLNQIRPVHHLHSEHAEQAAFAVLKSPSVPSLLVETSFITNPSEERLLGTTAFRQKIAGAIVDGILSYFTEFDAHNRRPAR